MRRLMAVLGVVLTCLAWGSVAATPSAAQEASFKDNLEVLRPFVGDWRVIPPEERPDTFYSSRRWTLDGAAIRTLEGFVRDGVFHPIVDNLTAWNSVEGEIGFQEHSSWGNFVRGRIEVLDDHVVRRHMRVWNVDGTYNLWWETFTYDPAADTFSMYVQRVVGGEPQDQGAQTIRFVRVDSIPWLPAGR